VKDGIKRAQVIPRGITLLLTLLLAFVATFFTIAFAWKPIPTDLLRRLIPQRASSGDNVSNTSADSRRPAMTINGGTMYLAWKEGEGTAAEIYFNKKVLGSWSDNVRVSNDASDCSGPAIAVTGNDGHLVWQDAQALNIVYKGSNNRGNTWEIGPEVIPDDDEDSFHHPSIGAGNDVLHATWDVDSGTGHFIEYSKSTDGGASWSFPVDISGDVTNNGDSTHPDIAVQGSNLFVVWSTLINETATSKTYTIRFNKSANGGVMWLTSSAPIAAPTISKGFINEFPVPRVAISDTNTIYVVWHQGIGKADVMSSVSTDGGVTWSATPDNVSNSSENAQLARVAVGSAPVVWEEQVGDKYDIFYKSTTGTEEEDGGGIYLPIIMKNSY
jgi:hypothetical protein